MNEQLHTPKPSRLLFTPAQEGPTTLRHFAPPETLDSDLAAWLHGKPRGIRVKVDEERMLKMFVELLNEADSPELANEAGWLAAIALYGSSQYLLDEPAAQTIRGVQNRYIELPRMSYGQQRVGAEEARDRTLRLLEHTSRLAIHATSALISGTASQQEAISIESGRAMACAAGYAASIGVADFLADTTNGFSSDGAQLFVRDRSLSAIQTMHSIGVETGYHASGIQTVNRFGPLGVAIGTAASAEFLNHYLPKVDQPFAA